MVKYFQGDQMLQVPDNLSPASIKVHNVTLDVSMNILSEISNSTAMSSTVHSQISFQNCFWFPKAPQNEVFLCFSSCCFVFTSHVLQKNVSLIMLTIFLFHVGVFSAYISTWTSL